MAGTKHPMLEPVYELEVCPWTAANPRHDHQLIFPLADGRLLLAWSEYYADRPAHAVRSAADLTDRRSAFHDDFPCRLSGKISSDGGRGWSDTFTLQENLWRYNVKHPNLIRVPSGDVILTFTAWESKAQRNVYMKRSCDDCETWGEIIRISEPGWYCTNNDHVFRTRSGRIILPSHGGPGFEFKPGNAARMSRRSSSSTAAGCCASSAPRANASTRPGRTTAARLGPSRCRPRWKRRTRRRC